MIIILFFLIFGLSTTAISISDKSTMDTLLSALTPTPFGWSSATNFCSWRGVKCDMKNRVISLSLASQSLSGTLPSSLNNLSRLTALSIENNHFSGPLPSLPNLSRLRKLYLHNNSFSSIPRGALSKLTSLGILSLSNNADLYPWPFPSELIDSTKLTALYASNANIMGSIPDILQSFPELANLTLSFNNLTGSLPSSFSSSSIQNLKIDNQKLGLTGNIDTLTGMNQLTLVWLQGNRFTGVVPLSFVSLPNLAYVRLENNKFKPPIPHFPNSNFARDETFPFNCRPCKVYIRVDHLANAPLAPFVKKPSSEKKPNVGAVVGYTFLLVFFVLMIFGCICYCSGCPENDGLTSEQVVEQRRHKIPEDKVERVRRPGKGKEEVVGPQPGRVNESKKEVEKEKVVLQLGKEGNRHPRKGGAVEQGGRGVEEKKQPQKEEVPAVPRDRNIKVGKQPQEVVEEQGYLPKKYSIDCIRTMTKNFDRRYVIGEGGFAQVYKGDQLNGTIVAVKCLKQKIGRIIDDFKNEVEALGRTRHFNLVKLIGYCAEDEHRMLVYEYMCNGSLEEWIFGTNPKRSLSWQEKKKVILGVGGGLVYLHEHCEKKILHRDLKPQNVLLDEKKNAKLCDFGISKLLERDQSSTSTMGMGTRGYMAPEVVKGDRISVKVDVYSFGILVLEVVFGKKYYDLKCSNQNFLESSRLLRLINDLSDEMRKNGKEIEMIAKLALLCLKEKPEDRPSMSEILGEIKRADTKVRRN